MLHLAKGLFVLAFSLSVLNAQHPHPSVTPAEKPVALLAGLGPYSHPIATSNPEAQEFFDQGLRLLYGFNRYESLRSFRRAAALDPNAIMPLWGIAMALGPHINMDGDGDTNLQQGCAALSRAQHRNGYESAYLQAALTRCPAYEPSRYTAAMQHLHEQYPDDPDAATLYAESLMVPVRWKWWHPDGSPAPGTAKAVEVLEQVMRRYPDHPGANHFYIHAVEMSPSPERAVPSAQRLMGIMPRAGHMVHMPAHIWLVLGDWETAATVNERAAQVDREYFQQTGVQGGYVGYYLHNLHFIAYARVMQGRASDAIAAADLLSRESASAAEDMAEMVDPVAAYTLFSRLRFGRWDDLLALPEPPAKLVAFRSLRHWARAIAYQAKGNDRAAVREAALFRSTSATIAPQRPWMTNQAAPVLQLASAVLEARLSPTDYAAVKQWRRAVDLQDRLSYDEPPPWYMPLRESLGGALLRAGDAATAETVFREGLRHTPRNGRLLFGLWRSLEAQHKTEDAQFVRAEFEREWKHADVALRMADF